MRTRDDGRDWPCIMDISQRSSTLFIWSALQFQTRPNKLEQEYTRGDRSPCASKKGLAPPGAACEVRG
jgi:hypothetical protein